MAIKIDRIDAGSEAEALGLQPGDELLSVDENELNDTLDYDFYTDSSSFHLKAKVAENGYKFALLLVTDIFNEGSKFICEGAPDAQPVSMQTPASIPAASIALLLRFMVCFPPFLSR